MVAQIPLAVHTPVRNSHPSRIIFCACATRE